MKRNFRSLLKTKKRKTEKELQHIQDMQISDNENKNSVSNLEESVESGEISSSSSEWNLGSDDLFVTCLNCNSKNKIGKPIETYLDLIIITSLKHMSIRSRLASQPKNKLISNSEQTFNATDLSPITFAVILPPKLRGKIATNSQINPVT